MQREAQKPYKRRTLKKNMRIGLNIKHVLYNRTILKFVGQLCEI